MRKILLTAVMSAAMCLAAASVYAEEVISGTFLKEIGKYDAPIILRGKHLDTECMAVELEILIPVEGGRLDRVVLPMLAYRDMENDKLHHYVSGNSRMTFHLDAGVIRISKASVEASLDNAIKGRYNFSYPELEFSKDMILEVIMNKLPGAATGIRGRVRLDARDSALSHDAYDIDVISLDDGNERVVSRLVAFKNLRKIVRVDSDVPANTVIFEAVEMALG